MNFTTQLLTPLRTVGATMIFSAAVGATAANAGETYDRIIENGEVRCGVAAGSPGFSIADDDGNWSGFAIDLCRAVATAIFDDPAQAKIVPLGWQHVFPGVQSGEIDTSLHGVTATVGRDTDLGFNFPSLYMMSGHNFMVPKSKGVSELQELEGASICILQGATVESNVAQYFKGQDLAYEQAIFDNAETMYQAYEAGRCDAIVSEPNDLASRRTAFEDPQAHVILEEAISKEPLSFLTAQGDEDWNDTIKIVFGALLQAEEVGITSENVAELSDTKNYNQRVFLGLEGDILGERFGWKANWAARVVEELGNYGELWETHLGLQTKVALPRGPNRLWNQGGVLYAPAWR